MLPRTTEHSSDTSRNAICAV